MGVQKLTQEELKEERRILERMRLQGLSTDLYLLQKEKFNGCRKAVKKGK